MKLSSIARTAKLTLLIALLGAAFALAQKAEPNTSTAPVSPLLKKVLSMNAQAPQSTTALTQQPSPLERRTTFVKMADFYLKDGKLAFGKLVEEDKNKITVEQVLDSSIVVTTYGKNQIEPRTLQIKSIPTTKYYLDMAEYFAGKTWDFKDDPDDFISAIRFYEKAKLAISSSSDQDLERISEINQKIKDLQADREVWSREIQTRAKLKELEFQAEHQTRFKELQVKIDESSQKLADNSNQLEKRLTEIRETQQRLEQNFAGMDQELRRQLTILTNEIEANRRMIDPLYRGAYRRYGSYNPGVGY